MTQLKPWSKPRTSVKPKRASARQSANGSPTTTLTTQLAAWPQSATSPRLEVPSETANLQLLALRPQRNLCHEPRRAPGLGRDNGCGDGRQVRRRRMDADAGHPEGRRLGGS